MRLWSVDEKKCLSVVQRAHPEGGVLSLQPTATNALVSQGRDGTVKVWSVGESAVTCVYKLETNSLSLGKCASVLDRMPQGQSGLTPAADGDAGVTLDSLSMESDRSVVAPLDNLLAISADEAPSQIELWGFDSRQVVARIGPSTSTPSERVGMAMVLKLVRDDVSLKLYGGFENGSVYMWDVRNATTPLASTHLHTEPVLSLAISGDQGVSGSGDSKIVEFKTNLEKGQFDILATHNVNNNGISDIKIRGDQKIFATAGWDRRVRVFNFRKHTPLAILKYHTDSIYSVAFSSHNVLASASKDMRIALWNIYK
eukprot:gene13298-15630_t